MRQAGGEGRAIVEGVSRFIFRQLDLDVVGASVSKPPIVDW
jgi:hypothetical protein